MRFSKRFAPAFFFSFRSSGYGKNQEYNSVAQTCRFSRNLVAEAVCVGAVMLCNSLSPSSWPAAQAGNICKKNDAAAAAAADDDDDDDENKNV